MNGRSSNESKRHRVNEQAAAAGCAPAVFGPFTVSLTQAGVVVADASGESWGACADVEEAQRLVDALNRSFGY